MREILSGSSFANAKSKDTADDAFHMAGKEKKRIFNKTKEWRRGAKRNASILPNETAIEKRARAHSQEREEGVCILCACMSVRLCMLGACVGCVHASE